MGQQKSDEELGDDGVEEALRSAVEEQVEEASAEAANPSPKEAETTSKASSVLPAPPPKRQLTATVAKFRATVDKSRQRQVTAKMLAAKKEPDIRGDASSSALALTHDEGARQTLNAMAKDMAKQVLVSLQAHLSAMALQIQEGRRVNIPSSRSAPSAAKTAALPASSKRPLQLALDDTVAVPVAKVRLLHQHAVGVQQSAEQMIRCSEGLVTVVQGISKTFEATRQAAEHLSCEIAAVLEEFS